MKASQYHRAVAGGSMLAISQRAMERETPPLPRGGTDLMTRIKLLA